MKTFFSILIIPVILLSACKEETRIKNNQSGGLFVADSTGKAYTYYDKDLTVKLDTKPSHYFPLTYFEAFHREHENGNYGLRFTLNPAGKSELEKFTKDHLNEQVYFVINDQIISDPVIRGVISGGQISLSVREKEKADELAKFLSN